MQHIVAAFNDMSSARLALNQLSAAGVPRDHLGFKPSPGADFMAHAGPSRRKPGRPGYQEHGVLESIGDFFANLFESHTDESGIYGKDLRPGTSLVLVEAEEGEQVRRAMRIMQDCGAVRLEDHVGHWRLEGWEPAPGPAS